MSIEQQIDQIEEWLSTIDQMPYYQTFGERTKEGDRIAWETELNHLKSIQNERSERKFIIHN